VEHDLRDGSTVTGLLCQDTVSLGGIDILNQTFGLAETISAGFIDDTNKPALDSLMGMNLGQDQASIMWNLFAELDQPLFTADLQKGKPGSYDFGFIDDTKYTGKIVNVPSNAWYDGIWSPVVRISTPVGNHL
jgi:aspergillopepsin I